VKITRIDAIHVTIPMTIPFRKAGRVQHDADNALVRVEADDGSVGWGEAASAPLLTGETGARIASSIEFLSELVIGEDPRGLAGLHSRMSRAMAHNESAVCALDIALHDLVGRSMGVPIYQLIGGRNRETLPSARGLNADPADADKAAKGRAEGVQAFKVKVSIADRAYEQGAIADIRAAIGPDTELAIDANGNWAGSDASRFLDGIADLNVAFCEQPVAPGSLERMRAVAERSPIPIYTDESLDTAMDLIDHAAIGVAGVSMKPIKMGGITGFMSAAKLAAMLGLAVNVAGKEVGSSIAGAALLHIGTALPEVSGGISLSNHKLGEDTVSAPVGLAGGELRVPDGPGLGIAVDESVVDKYTQNRHTVTG
jgi:muconate cycloisomerase